MENFSGNYFWSWLYESHKEITVITVAHCEICSYSWVEKHLSIPFSLHRFPKLAPEYSASILDQNAKRLKRIWHLFLQLYFKRMKMGEFWGWDYGEVQYISLNAMKASILWSLTPSSFSNITILWSSPLSYRF